MCVSRSRICHRREAANFIRARMKVVVISPLRVVFLPLATRDGSTRGEDFAPPGCIGSVLHDLSCEVVVGC